MAVYAALILILSVIPAHPQAPLNRLDKLAHLGEYLLFSWLLLGAMEASAWQGPRRVWSWAAAAGYGLLLEGVQHWLPWRSGDWADALANTVGAALGVWCAGTVKQWGAHG